jgi:MoxR-like ATPase
MTGRTETRIEAREGGGEVERLRGLAELLDGSRRLSMTAGVETYVGAPQWAIDIRSLIQRAEAAEARVAVLEGALTDARAASRKPATTLAELAWNMAVVQETIEAALTSSASSPGKLSPAAKQEGVS